MSDKIIDFIQTEFNKRKIKNEKYSLRAFAKKINVEHSMLSKILSKKRPITFEVANRIFIALKVELSIRNSLLLTLVDERQYIPGQQDNEFVFLSEKELGLTYRWYFYGILSALEIEQFTHTPEGLSEFLQIPITIVIRTLKILTKLGAIEIDSVSKKIKLTGNCYSTSNNSKSDSLIKAHIDHINESIKYLRCGNIQGDYTGSTMSIPIDKLDEARRRIKEFRRSLAAWLSEDSCRKTDVYRINIQLFPLGKVRKT